jgi:hypothetical protein
MPPQQLHYQDGLALLYIGIAPSRSESSTNLRKRLRLHIRRDASVSTLRLSLGCLLSGVLKIELCRTSTGRHTFGSGEVLLTNWLKENAFVTWFADPQPWVLEQRLIRELSLPLNLRGNESHPFYSQLAAIRREANRQARKSPCLP